MKTLTIYERKVLVRTRYVKYRFKEVTQVSIIYNNIEYRNHDENINNPKLKKIFVKTFETRSTKELEKYVANLGRSDSDIFKKDIIYRYIKEGIK